MGKVGLEAFWPNDKSKWSENNRRGEGGRWKTILSVFLLFSSGNVNSTNFEYSTLHSLDSVDAFDTYKEIFYLDSVSLYKLDKDGDEIDFEDKEPYCETLDDSGADLATIQPIQKNT